MKKTIAWIAGIGSALVLLGGILLLFTPKVVSTVFGAVLCCLALETGIVSQILISPVLLAAGIVIIAAPKAVGGIMLISAGGLGVLLNGLILINGRKRE
ncbi:MAG: hypothetical protein IJZ37_05920 [Clostridia bacterium]|nr:hypothetical protein [Clostridia bacterium]MBQ8398429.1 hypothetical protein [Clostridia bacterium]